MLFATPSSTGPALTAPLTLEIQALPFNNCHITMPSSKYKTCRTGTDIQMFSNNI